jgi:uncharacterized protein
MGWRRGRGQAQEEGTSSTRDLRLFFASDIHGSEVCLRKWVNSARALDVDILILGGDISGKAVVPLLHRNASWTYSDYGQTLTAETAAELAEVKLAIRKRGSYGVVIETREEEEMLRTPEGSQAFFVQAARDGLCSWVELVNDRLGGTNVQVAMMLGNDDPPELAEVLADAGIVQPVEGRVVELSEGLQMASWGRTNPTPWDTPRESSEADLWNELQASIRDLEVGKQWIFNFHAPPIDSGLDVAPRLSADLRPMVGLGGVETASVGSVSVRRMIEEHEPLLSLHGHIHESAGVAQIGRTTSVNPGSDYSSGVLCGALVRLGKKRPSCQLIRG